MLILLFKKVAIFLLDLHFLHLDSNLAQVHHIGGIVLSTSWTNALLLMWVGSKWVKVQDSLGVETGEVQLIWKWLCEH